jgi:subtilisin family serine protease
MGSMPRLSRRTVTRTLAPMLTLILVATLAPAGLLAAGATDEILIRFREGTPPATRAAIARDAGLTDPDAGRGDGLSARRARAEVLRTELYESSGRSLATLRRVLEADPNVEGVALNGRYELAVDPADPSDEELYGDLWGLDNQGQTVDGYTGVAGFDIDGRQAFGIEQGDPELVVAVVDDGIDFEHVDLADRAWTNPGESGGGKETNGIDDDGNGFVDDVHGWDFCNDDATVHDAEEDAHGTHVAGTIAATRNGQGVVGVAPGIKLMALKFIDEGPLCGSDLMAIDALDYARDMGVHIINASWGGPGYNALLEDAIEDSGALFVAAAGNYAWNLDGDGPDVGTLRDPRFYPASFTLPNVLSVAAIDQKGRRATFSNYGAISVDIAAPGTNILSTFPGGGTCGNACYAWSAGTSMAAPHVTGVAALIGSRSQTVLADPLVLKSRLLATGTALASTTGRTVTGRLVNAYRAVDPVAPTVLPVSRHGVNVGTVVSTTSVSTSMVWPGGSDDLSGIASYWLQRSANGGSWSTVTAATTARSAKRDLVFGTQYSFRLRARDRAGNVSAPADSPVVQASLVQESTSLATYAGTWSTTTTSTALGGKMRTSTSAGSTVEFQFTGRAIGIVAPKGSTRGSVKVYVDGAYVQTVSLYRSSTQSRVVVFATSWELAGRHRVKLVTVATSGRTRVDIDGVVILK